MKSLKLKLIELDRENKSLGRYQILSVLILMIGGSIFLFDHNYYSDLSSQITGIFIIIFGLASIVLCGYFRRKSIKEQEKLMKKIKKL